MSEFIEQILFTDLNSIMRQRTYKGNPFQGV